MRIWMFWLLLLSATSHADHESFWMVREGKHVNVVFLTADAEPVLGVPLDPGLPLVMVSWGDAAYYQSSRKSLRMTARALLLPTPAAINLRQLRTLQEAPQTHDRARVYAMRVSHEGRLAMLRSIQNALGGTLEAGTNAWVGGRFYAALDHRYSVLYTCNNWVGELLRTGGLPFSPHGGQLASTLVAQHKAGWLLRPSHRRRAPFSGFTVSRVQP